MKQSPRNLKDDTRGAILVLGIVFGALLVGALWHVASIGDAIAWRERAQDAADAGAFENAVWNARGMNVIAAINIVMSLVLMVLVIWRTLLILVTVALIVAAILCVITLGLGCGFAASVARLETWMLQNDNTLATNIVRVLAGMNAAEVAVASSTPLVGMFTAAANTSGAYDISSASTQSGSLVPSINIKGMRTMARCFTGLRGGTMPKKPEATTWAGKAFEFQQDFIDQPRMGIGVSLPVQNESYSLLCEKAGVAALNNIAGVLERIGAPSGAVKGIDKAIGFLGPVFGSLPGIFCAPMAKGKSPAGVDDLVGKRAVESCKSDLESKREFVDHDGVLEIQYRNEDGKLVSEDDYVKDCAKKKQKQANEKLNDSFSTDSASYDLTECGTPAKVWEWSVNGNFFMRSFAQVEKEAKMRTRDDKGLEIADMSETGNVVVAEDDEVNAHAEMYSDCDQRWMDCRGTAMWSLRWRARLRRVQPIESLLATAIEPALTATLTQFLNQAGGKYGDKLLAKKGVPRIVVPKLKDTYYYRYVKTNWVMRGLYDSGVFSGAGRFVIDHAEGDSAIH